MSKDQKQNDKLNVETVDNFIKDHRIKTINKHKELGYIYCVHTLRFKSSSVKFYKTYSAAKRYMHKQLENPKNLLSTIFELENFKVIFCVSFSYTEQGAMKNCTKRLRRPSGARCFALRGAAPKTPFLRLIQDL